MKLILCVKCSDVFKLQQEYKECSCGSCGGKYLNDIDAEYWGEEGKVFMLGFANNSLIDALKQQIAYGDSEEKFEHGYYKGYNVGRRFEAFIMPNDAPTVSFVNKDGYAK